MNEIYFDKYTKPSCSLNTTKASNAQLVHKPYLTHFFDVESVVFDTAKNETNKKARSNHSHHEGAPAQQEAEQVLATNKTGVSKQCTKQSPLATIPTISDF